jgi:hypothetical protein
MVRIFRALTLRGNCDLEIGQEDKAFSRSPATGAGPDRDLRHFAEETSRLQQDVPYTDSLSAKKDP